MSPPAEDRNATRHMPVAIGPEDPRTSRERAPQLRRTTSETRLQAAVVGERRREDGDEYADVPCTD